MTETIKELKVEPYDPARKIMFIAKTLLLSSEKLNLIAQTKSSPAATRAAETLKRLGYVTIENIQTFTEIHNNLRSIKLIIELKKTKDFDSLYKKNEEEREKKKQEK